MTAQAVYFQIDVLKTLACAPQRRRLADDRFGSKADIVIVKRSVITARVPRRFNVRLNIPTYYHSVLPQSARTI
jgi:hypothetical protein